MTNKKNHKDRNNEEKGKQAFLLKEVGKENPFLVPEDFFERQQARIKERIATDHRTEKGRKFSIPIHTRYVMAIAAVAAAVVLFISIFNNASNGDSDLFQDITFEQLMTETPEYVYSLDESEMMEFLFLDADYSVYEVFGQQFISDSSAYEESILDYLIEEEISSELLYN